MENNPRLSLSGHQSAAAKSTDWLTPPEWINALGPFDTDPACPTSMPWRTAARMFDRDGLEREWIGRVWLNPPFGREAAAWLRKMATHNNGIALIPARTETAMFYESVWGAATSVCFVKGRPHFYRPDGSRAPFDSGAPIVLVAYGDFNMQALIQAKLGAVLPCPPRNNEQCFYCKEWFPKPVEYHHSEDECVVTEARLKAA